MKIYFLQIEFCLKFSFPTFMDSNPMFVLRSVLGKNLHTMCCISRKSKCAECQFSKTCVYAFLFETILSSDNGTLPGRNRASHPYSFSSTQNLSVGNFLKEYSFEMTLFGRAIEYLPYIYMRLLYGAARTDFLKVAQHLKLKMFLQMEKIF